MAFPLPSPGGPPAPEAVPTKDPALNLVEEIEAKLEELKQMLGGTAEVEEPDELAPQSDDEVAAGVAPEPKKKVPGGSAFNF